MPSCIKSRRYITAITANTLRVLIQDMNPVLRQYVSHAQTHRSFEVQIKPTFENRIGITAISSWLLRLYQSMRVELAKQPVLGQHVRIRVNVSYGMMTGFQMMYGSTA